MKAEIEKWDFIRRCTELQMLRQPGVLVEREIRVFFKLLQRNYVLFQTLSISLSLTQTEVHH